MIEIEKINWIISRALATKVENLKWDVNWNNYYSSKFKKKFIDFYVDNMSFEDFKKSIIESDNYTNSLKYLKKIVTIAYNKLKENSIVMKRKEVESTLVDYMLLQKWRGFSFEYEIKCKLLQKGFKAYEDSYLDDKFAIDLVVELDDRCKIGIQCKSQYYKFGADYTHKHYRKSCRAIDYNWVNEVYYLFHNENCDIVSMRKGFESAILIDVEWITQKDIKKGKTVIVEQLIKEIEKIKK